MSKQSPRSKKIRWLPPLTILGWACLVHAVALGVAMLMWNGGSTDVSISLAMPGAMLLMNLVALGLLASSPAPRRRTSRCARLGRRRSRSSEA